MQCFRHLVSPCNLEVGDVPGGFEGFHTGTADLSTYARAILEVIGIVHVFGRIVQCGEEFLDVVLLLFIDVLLGDVYGKSVGADVLVGSDNITVGDGCDCLVRIWLAGGHDMDFASIHGGDELIGLDILQSHGLIGGLSEVVERDFHGFEP